MTKRRKLIKVLIIIAAVLLIGIISFGAYIYAYLKVCFTDCEDMACALADYHPVPAEMMNTRVDYEILPDEYKKAISYEQYTGADTPEELLELYSNEIFHKYSERQVDQHQSTSGYKNQEGAIANFEAGGQWYYLRHEIDFSPDFLTLEAKVVRWYTEIREIEEEDLPVLY